MSRFPTQGKHAHLERFEHTGHYRSSPTTTVSLCLKCVMKASMNPNAYGRAEIEEIVKMVRLNLYNRAKCCGTQAIRQQLDKEGVRPLPSLRTINRIVRRHGLTYGRTGHYE